MRTDEFRRYIRSRIFGPTGSSGPATQKKLRGAFEILFRETVIRKRRWIGRDELARRLYGGNCEGNELENTRRTILRLNKHLDVRCHEITPSPTTPRMKVLDNRGSKEVVFDRQDETVRGYRLVLEPEITFEDVPEQGVPVPDRQGLEIVERLDVERGSVGGRPSPLREFVNLHLDPTEDFMDPRTMEFIPLTRLRAAISDGKITDYELESANAAANQFFGLPADSRETEGMTGERLFEMLARWMSEQDFKKFEKDQIRVMRDYGEQGYARAKIPIRINEHHPDKRFKNREFIPAIVRVDAYRPSSDLEIHRVLIVYGDRGVFSPA